MSVQADRERWVVRWRDGSGRQRGRRFESEASARTFDAGLREVAPRERRADGAQRAGGVYPYPTKRGTRWYFKVRDSSGRQTTRRGFTSEKAAHKGGTIVVYRSRKRGETVGSTKSDRFRLVEVGPSLSRVLRDHLARQAEMASEDGRLEPIRSNAARR
jgi:uncharacterized protein YjhX (UPF0386 family)